MPVNWFIAQTGHSYGNTPLSEKGRKQIEKLGIILNDHLDVEPKNLAIFYTPSIRGEETAKILGKKSKKIRINELWTDSDKPKGTLSSIVSAHSKILKIGIQAKNYLIITDYSGTSEYPKYLSNKILSQSLDFSPLLRGEAYWLCLNAEEWKKLPSDERLYHSEKVMVKG